MADKTAGGPPPQAFSYQGPPPPGHQQSGPSGPPPPYPVAQHTNEVIAQQPITHVISFNETPVRMQCPSCSAEILTNTHFETGTFTFVVCAFLVFLGLWLFCCLIPFCIDSCKDVVHSCPSCRHVVGRYNRM